MRDQQNDWEVTDEHVQAFLDAMRAGLEVVFNPQRPRGSRTPNERLLDANMTTGRPRQLH